MCVLVPMCLTGFCRFSGLAVVPPAFVCCAAFMLVIVVAVEGNSSCPTRAYMRIQETCRAKNEILVEAEKNKDEPKLVCAPLRDLLRCVTRIASRCLQDYIEVYKKYFSSPRDCSMGEDIIIELQELAKKDHSQHGGGEGEGDGDSTSPPPTTPPDETTSTSADDDDDDDDGGGGGDGGGHVTVADNRKGDSHKHTGNRGSSISSHYGVPLALTSLLAALRMTSYLLRS